MRLERFTANTNQQAIAMIKASLGPDALIYSSRRVLEGVEVVAGVPVPHDVAMKQEMDKYHLVETAKEDHSWQKFADSVSSQLAEINRKLSSFTPTSQSSLMSANEQMGNITEFKRFSTAQLVHLNQLFCSLMTCGFSSEFSSQLLTRHFGDYNFNDDINSESMENILYGAVQTIDVEKNASPSIIALLGAPGSGKPTTIIELCQRYANQYGKNAVGVITMDYNDISGLNKLLYYMRLLDIVPEYADSTSDLLSSINQLQDKQFILIDTQSVTHYELEKINQLRKVLRSSPYEIDCLLTMPCHLQETMLRHYLNAYLSLNLTGCVITNQNLHASVVTPLGLCIEYGLKIAYCLNGKELSGAIQPANKDKLIQSIIKSTLPNEDDYICA